MTLVLPHLYKLINLSVLFLQYCHIYFLDYYSLIACIQFQYEHLLLHPLSLTLEPKSNTLLYFTLCTML